MSLIQNDTSLQGSLFGGMGRTSYSRDHADILADIRKDVGEAQSTVKDSIFLQQLHSNVEFRHLNDRQFESQRDTLKQTLENKFKLAEIESSLSKQIIEKNFCTERILKDELSKLKEDNLKSRLDCTRDELAAMRCNSNANATQNTLEAILKALEKLATPPTPTPTK